MKKYINHLIGSQIKKRLVENKLVRIRSYVTARRASVTSARAVPSVSLDYSMH